MVTRVLPSMTVASSVEDPLSPPPAGDIPVGRSSMAVVSIGIAALCLLQAPGKVVADTKLDIAIAPLTFLGRALYLWSPVQQFGGVPYQAYGYFFPMGPFFAAGHALGIPTWVVQRLWVSAVLIVGFWGAVRLAEALDIGSRPARVLAGLAFVFAAPATLLGATSAYLLSFALLPWIMIPLVTGSQRGSTRLAAARSGLALLFLGGTNAAAVLAVLPLPMLWLLTRTPGRRRRELLSWWVLSVFLACAWWGFLLLLEGRFGFNLLPFTESPSITTAMTSAFNVIRGNSYWLAYDQIGPTAIRSGWESITSPVMILGSAAVAALGLYGLAHRRMKERTWLVSSLVACIVLIGCGYPGHFGGPLSASVRDVLNGPLALFRNVWKFQPGLNLVIALGMAHGLSVLVGRRERRGVRGSRASVGRPHPGRLLALPLVALAVIGLTVPFLTDAFYPARSFGSVPPYWQATASWLNRHAGSTTSLVVPGSPTGAYKWGNPLDEPMQWLSDSNWAVRDLDPDGSVGSIETLDAVERALASGVPSPGLAAFLAQAGVRFVVVRNDLTPDFGAPTPLLDHFVLSETPGLRRAATFGPRSRFAVARLHFDLPAIEVYQVRSPVRVVTTAPVANSVLVSGGAQALLSMDQLGLNPGNRAVVVAGDSASNTKNQTWVVTDTERRVDETFGYVRNNETYVLLPHEMSPLTGRSPAGLTLVPGAGHQTVAAFIGVKDITASSFGSSLLALSPQDQPSAALDGNADTAWVADSADNSQGQWLQVDFKKARPLAGAVLRLHASAATPRVTQVTVSSATGSVTQRVRPTPRPQLLRVPGGRTPWLRVTISKAQPARHGGVFLTGAGIAELTIPGVSAQKAEAVPVDELHRFTSSAARLPVYIFSSPSSTTGLITRDDDQEPRLVRVFTTPRSESATVGGVVSARAGVSADAVFRYLNRYATTDGAFHIPCGSGPTLTLDGSVLQTQVTGKLGLLGVVPQIRFDACPVGAPLTLSAGKHVLQGNETGTLKISSVALSPAAQQPYAPATSPARSVSVRSWGVEHRAVAVAPGAASYLVVKQNYNSGWTAQLHGHQLRSVRMNGWQQGWVVPKGSGGLVTMTYGPDRLYHVGLAVGGALALLLLGLALWPSRKEHPAKTRGPRAVAAPIAAIVGVLALACVSGVLAVMLPVLLLAARLTRTGRWLPPLAGLAFFAAGVVVAVQIGAYPASATGAFGVPAQVLSILALAAVLCSCVLDAPGWSSRRVDHDVDAVDPAPVRPRPATSDVFSGSDSR